MTDDDSKDHRPDLQPFWVDVLSSNDGDAPLFLRVGDGKESDSAVFGNLIAEFQQQCPLDSVYGADAVLYTANARGPTSGSQQVSRAPLTLKAARQLVDELATETFVPSSLAGDTWVERTSDDGGVPRLGLS